MFLSVVVRPMKHRYFDDRILLKSDSEIQVITKLSAHTNLSDIILTCDAIKAGEWKQLVDCNIHLSTDKIIYTVASN